MRTLKILLTQMIACLIITTFSIGQSTFNLADGGLVHIDSGTVFQMNDLYIGAGSQLVNRGNLTVNGVLANFAGTPGLILQADEDGYGSLMHYTPSVPATVEQHLLSERWHLVTSPVTQSTIVVYEGIYLKEWSESNSEWTYLVQPTTIPMNQYEGYSAWASDALTGSTTVTFEGNLKAGNGAFTNLTYTSASQGWNLVGNPYPSPVEWNTNWFLNNVGGWAIVYENGTFKGWNPWMPAGERSYNGKTDGFIAPTQGFWIRTTGSSPYVSIPQTARAHNAVSFLKDAEISELMSLHLIVSANEFEDETTILFLEEATNGFDDLYDLEKHMNVTASPNIYTIPQVEKKYAVNVLPADWIETNSPAIVSVGFEIGPESNCTLTANGIDNFDPSIEIYLEDLKESTFQSLNENSSYVFTASEQDDPQRFLLHFGLANTVQDESDEQISVYSHEDCIYISMPNSATGYTQVIDMEGRKISSFKVYKGLNKEKVDQTGFYVVLVQSPESSAIKKVFIKK